MTAILAAVTIFAPSAENSLLQPLVMFPLIFLIFYFVVMAPQKKQRQKHEEGLRSIKKGDEIVTAGGIIGTVIHVRDTMKDGQATPGMEDRVTIKSGESRLEVERGRIARVASRAGAATGSSGSSSAA